MSDLIERVVIQLDAASETRDAIDTAARLAAQAKALLLGIFVEDEDLLGLANLPFARQVSLDAGSEPLTLVHVEWHLRVAAERARQDLAAAAERRGVAWSFEVVRGSSVGARFDASERDLVVAGALTRPVAGQFRVECRWWSSINAAPGPFLLTRRAWEASGAVLIMLRDRSQGSVRLLDVAGRIAEVRNTTMTLICTAELARAEGFETWIADHLVPHSRSPQIELAPADATALLQRMLELDCGLLAVEASSIEDWPDRIRELVERLACDLLVVR
jgi:nucleotide-binding universal stress UspA family protein